MYDLVESLQNLHANIARIQSDQKNGNKYKTANTEETEEKCIGFELKKLPAYGYPSTPETKRMRDHSEQNSSAVNSPDLVYILMERIMVLS
ncbi:hypothetical protein Tco_0322645 [Tanacetum coccineum]